MGKEWTKAEIWEAVKRGRHVSALSAEALEHFKEEARKKVATSQAKIVEWDTIKPIRDSRLCRLRSDGFSLNNHVPLDDGTHLITMKPTGFYSRVST